MYKKICISVVIACYIFTLAVSAQELTQDAEGCLFVVWDDTTDAITYYNVGDYLDTDMQGVNIACGPCIYTDFNKGCTYTIRFRLYYSSHYLKGAYPPELKSVSIHEELPYLFTELVPLVNSEGVANAQFVDFTYGESLGGFYQTFTLVFSTAEGYIDNFTPGEQYFIFNCSSQSTYFSSCQIEDITVSCVYDPSAEYYQQICLEKLDEKGKELESVGGEASKHENWALDKAAELHAEASDQMSINLDIAKSFLQTSTFAEGGNSIAATAATFGTIYNQFTSALPPQLQSLIIIIPTLAFIGWVIGRVQ